MDHPLFNHTAVKLEVLRKRAFNYRWAEVEEGVIPLTAADPDFPAAPEIARTLQNYIQDGYFSYTPKLGLPEFRLSLSAALRRRKSEIVDPELILPIDSAARGMYVIAQTVLKPGDEAIIFDPVDYLFKQSVLAAGATPVLFPARIDGGSIDLSALENYITPRTRMIGLCNPHNPLGRVYSTTDLDRILTLANQYDLWIMNDEIWSDIVYSETPFCSILSLGAERNRQTLSVYGFSKSYAVAGLRIGCIYCQDPAIFQKIVQTSAVLTTAGGISSLSQIAGLACLEQCDYWLDAFVQYLQGNRDYAFERLQAMPGLTVHKPQATYLLFPDIRKTGLDSDQMVDYLKREAKLALVPGSDQFFGPGSAGHVRLSFATSREILTEGLNRLEAALKRLPNQ